MKIFLFIIALILFLSQIFVLLLKRNMILSLKRIYFFFLALMLFLISLFIGINFKVFSKCFKSFSFQDLLFIYFMFTFYYQICSLVCLISRSILKKEILFLRNKGQNYYLTICIKVFSEIYLSIALCFVLYKYKIESKNSLYILLIIFSFFLLLFLFKKLELIKKNDALLFEIVKSLFCFVILQTFLNIYLAIFFIVSTNVYDYIKFSDNRMFFDSNRRTQ